MIEALAILCFVFLITIVLFSSFAIGMVIISKTFDYFEL